jgi:hypothetical protein
MDPIHPHTPRQWAVRLADEDPLSQGVAIREVRLLVSLKSSKEAGGVLLLVVVVVSMVGCCEKGHVPCHDTSGDDGLPPHAPRPELPFKNSVTSRWPRQVRQRMVD